MIFHRRILQVLMLFGITSLLLFGQARLAFPLEKVVLRLNWTPWAMHAPYYMGQEKGYYAEEGLDVEIRPASGATQGPVLVASGKEHFGIGLSGIFLSACDKEVPVVAISADQPDTPIAIISLKEAGIKQPKDLIGKRLAHPQASAVRAIIDAALVKSGIDPKKVPRVEIPAASEIQMILAGKIDAFEGFYFGQPLAMADKGYETNSIILRDLGVEAYGTVIYTSKKLIKDRPDLAEKFLRGTLKGLIYSYNNTNEAVKFVLTNHAPDRRLPVEVEKLKRIFKLYQSTAYRDKGFGVMSDEKWQSTIQMLKGGGSIKSDLKPTSVYTNEFIIRVPESRKFADMLFSK